MLDAALREMERRGVSHRIPWIISEYGYSAFAARAEIGIEGALLNADIVGRFLTLGGDRAFLYGYTPSQVLYDSCSPGNNMLFSMDNDGNITHRFATYFGARLVMHEWTMPSGGWHEIYPATSDIKNRQGEALVTAYAVHRPDGLWSLLLINKDPEHAYRVQVRFQNGSTNSIKTLEGPLDVYQYSAEQYQLNDDKDHPYPIKADPPAYSVLQPTTPQVLGLPAYSLTIVRAQGPGVGTGRLQK
jgi:hypothetical protein